MSSVLQGATSSLERTRTSGYLNQKPRQFFFFFTFVRRQLHSHTLRFRPTRKIIPHAIIIYIPTLARSKKKMRALYVQHQRVYFVGGNK